MVRPARPGPSRTGSALAVSTWPCPTRSTPRCSSWTSTSQPLRQRAQRGAPAADRRPADPLGRARAQAHLGQSHPDQRHVPSAVADRLRLRRRQQCEHPPAGRDKALSRTRQPDGWMSASTGGNGPENSHRQSTVVTATGSAPHQWAGREHDADIMLPRKHQPRLVSPPQRGRTTRTARCSASKPGTMPTFCPHPQSHQTHQQAQAPETRDSPP